MPNSGTEYYGADHLSKLGIPSSTPANETDGGDRMPEANPIDGQIDLPTDALTADATISDITTSDAADIEASAIQAMVDDAGDEYLSEHENLLDGFHIYFGNFHSHTNYSDGENTPAEAFIWARDEIGLDFYAISDHALSLDESEWDDIAEQADAFNQEGEFVALRGFEYSNNTSGHLNVFFTDDYVSFIRYPILSFFYFWLDAASGLAQFNHPGRQLTVFDGFQYTDRVGDNIVLIETANKTVTNTRGSYLDYYARCLDQGWHVAPSSGQDNHDLSVSSIRTAYIGKTLSRDALVDAMRNRRLYSTDDPNMKVVLKHGDAFMGSVVDATGFFTRFTVWVEDDEPIQQLQLITNSGRVAEEISYDEETTDVVWSPWVRLFGRDYFFLKVIGVNKLDEGDDLQTAVTAPIWIAE